MFIFALMVVSYFAIGVFLAGGIGYYTYRFGGAYKDVVWLFLPIIAVFWPLLIAAFILGVFLDKKTKLVVNVQPQPDSRYRLLELVEGIWEYTFFEGTYTECKAELDRLEQIHSVRGKKYKITQMRDQETTPSH